MSSARRKVPVKPHDGLDVERYLLIDVRVTTCSRKQNSLVL